LDGEGLSGIQVLVRDGIFSFRNQVPAVVFLTKDVLYYGGCAATKNRFHRIPFKSIHSVSMRGRSFMKCIEVSYMALEGERKVLFCPFKGEPHQPEIDEGKLHELHAVLKKSVK